LPGTASLIRPAQWPTVSPRTEEISPTACLRSGGRCVIWLLPWLRMRVSLYTHCAVGLRLKAIECGYRVLFTNAAVMIAELTKALAEGRLEEKLKLHSVPRLLIIDEIGYLPIDQNGANVIFRRISRRYERGPMILTSNQAIGSWGDVFGDRVIAAAVLDRILHHAITASIRGNSCRLTDKLRAGLVQSSKNVG